MNGKLKYHKGDKYVYHLLFKTRERPSAHEQTRKTASKQGSKSSNAAWNSRQADKIVILQAQLNEEGMFHIPQPGFSDKQKV